MGGRMKIPALVLFTSLAVFACGGQTEADASAKTGSTVADSAPAGTPVQVAPVRLVDLDHVVRVPGRTVAIREERVRAPFAGTLVSLEVTDGDRVTRGQRIGALVARSSTAALAGAEALLATAESPEARSDAERALALARRELVERPLRTSSAGVVTSHSAVAGDVLGEGDEIVAVAASDGIVFEAQLSQADLPLVRPGQPARLSLVADSVTWPGRVETVLPAASTETLTVPVRIRPIGDGAARPSRTGLFGEAEIIVVTWPGVPVVPAAAVLRDDVSGVTRIAIVGPDERLQWRNVETGISRDGIVQITSPALTAGQSVITSGHVGLSDGAAVRPQP